MSEEKMPEIKYTMPEINLNFDDNIIRNNPLDINRFLNQLENIENIRNNSLIMTEINNSKIQFNQPSSKINNSLILIHNGILCEKCKNCPIIGHRYKCPKCLNYNLCEECEQLNSECPFHPHSNFILYRIPEAPIINNEYSYDCLTKNLEIKQKCGTESFEIEIKIKNSGYLTWPEGKSLLKCRKELSTIFCDKCILPPINMNEETDVVLKFKKCSKIPKGNYVCYVNCVIEKKIIRGPIIINVIFE